MTTSLGDRLRLQCNTLSSVSNPRVRHNTKLWRILDVLARGDSLHRFQAERLGDHVLHSTVCKIQGYGIQVEREWITIPGFAGHPTRVCRYWLSTENCELAARLLRYANAA